MTALSAKRIAALTIACALQVLSPAASARHARHDSQDASAGTTGAGFTYYVLSLSWSPSYCAGARRRAGDLQCGGGRPYDFVVHGLWPQFDRGWPEDCPSDGRPGPGRDEVDRMLDLMPSPDLVRHEWKKHGTCSGLTVAGYFEAIRHARESIRIPARFARPLAYQTVSPAELKSEFLKANPTLPADAIAVTCKGRDLQELRVCFDTGLKPRACGANEARQCRSPGVVLPPVR